MNDNGIAKTNLPFWYNVNDNEFTLKALSQHCEFMQDFKQVEYNIDVEFETYKTKT